MKDNYRFYEVNGEEYKIGDWESSEFEKDFPTAKVNMSVNGENYLIGINERDEFMKDFAGSEVSYTNFGPTRKEERQARREERQNDGKTTFGETLGKSAAAAGVRTGKLALDLARAAWNTGVVGGAINFMTGKKFDEKLQDEDNRITQWSTKLGETADRLSREADPTGGEKGYVDLIKEGNIGQVAQKALASGIESLPMMLAAGSGWGMLLYGAGMAAGEYSDETRENPDIPSWKRAINSMGSAALEMAVEKIGGPLNDLGKAGKEITEDMAKEILETAVKEGSDHIAKRIVKKLGTMVKQGAEEGVEEVVTSFGNDVLGTSLDLIDGDADYGIQAQWNQLKEQNPDASLTDFAKEKGKEYMDAFIGGAVSGLEISTTTEGLGAGVNALRNNESRNIMQHAREVGSSMSYDDLYDTDSDVANAKTAVANSFADKDGNPTISNEFIESLSAEDAYALAGREDFSYQQRRAFGELAIAKAKSDALNGRLDTMRDERVATIRSRMEKASENGQIVTGMVDGRVVYVRGGKVNNREVSVDKHGGHGPLLVIDSVTGEEKVVNSKDITSASVLNAEETINGMVNFILNNEASDRQTARTTMSKRAKIAAVNEFIGKRMMINSENGIIEVEVTASPQSGKVLIKGKKGDLGGQAIKPMDADVFYDSIYRNENGEPIFVEKGEGETEEVEVPETPTAPEAPVAAGVAEDDDFRDFTGTILVDGAPLNVSVISQDGPSDTIVYEYEDENGNTRRASTTIGAFKTAVHQGAEYAPEAPVVPETPVAETPVAEEVPPTEETPTEEEAPVEVELGPDDIDWDALFDSDPEAYFVELQKQFGDGAIDMLTAVVEATQEELDGLNKNKGKTQKEIFANVTKKKELQNKIDILNGMIDRLTAAPAPETAPDVVPDSVAEPMPEPAPETAPVVETPAPAPVEEPAPAEPVETEPVEEPVPEVETPPTDPDEEDGTGPIDPKAKEIVLDNGYIIKDGYVINPTPIEMPNSPKDFSRIFIAEKDGKWGYETYVKFDNMTSYGSPKGAIQVSASHQWFDTKEEAIKAALHYFDFLVRDHGSYKGKPHGNTGIDAFIQYVKDTYLGNDPTGTEKPEGGETAPEAPTEPKTETKPKVKIPKFNVKDILLKGTGPSKGHPYTGIHYEDGYAVTTNGFVIVAKKEAYPAENEGKVITPKGEELSVKFPKWKMLLKDFVNKDISFDIQDMYEFVMSIKDKYGKQWGEVTVEIEDKNGHLHFFPAKYLLPFLKAANEFGGEMSTRGNFGIALMISSDKGTAMVQSKPQANTNNERYNAPVPQTNEPSPQPVAHTAPTAPTAPTVVDNPIEVAKMKDANLLKQIMRIDIPTAQKRDLAYSTGKQVADLFATREEYDAYAENAQNFGAYNEDYERGVDASFANRPQNPDDTPGKSVPLENEPKGGENGGETDAPKGDDTVRPADGGTGGGTDNGGSKAGDKGNPKAIPSQGKGGSEGGKESGKVKHQYPARKGNVTGKILIDTFGLAAVDIPNSRKEILNTFYDFMMEMSKILGISPKSIGNGGWLTLGNLRANARAFARHTVLYKTFGGDIVEQHLLLKYSRVSSIAHEWWHALDHALAFFEKGKNKGPTTEIATGAFDGRQETLEAVRAIMQAIRDSGYTSRIQSHPLYTRDFKNYVLEPTESAARAFAEYMRNKFAENGIAITGVNEFYDDTQPTAEEMKLITPAIENLFNVLQEKEGKTPGTSILYHIGEMMDEQSDAKKLATEAVLTALDDTGIEVVRASDEQTQQMIDASGENTEFMISPDNPVFVSNAAMAVAGIKMEKATPAQWLAMIEKNGGLKAGEDKWMGLSDWLKASDRKTLTKAEVLDFISDNMIQIEEQHYGDMDEETREFVTDNSIINMYGVSFRDSFNTAFVIEEDFIGGWYVDVQDYEEAVSLYNEHNEDKITIDPIDIEYESREETLLKEWATSVLKNAEQNDGVKPINTTRKNYTTDGLENLHEIALTVPTIEPWNEEDEIHFGDAGEGRAVAWIRFGETEVTVQDETQQRLNEIYDRLAELEMKVSSTGITEEEYNERARLRTERDELQEIKPKTQRVLVIDEIQSKRHQEGRESGYKVSREKADAEMDKFMKRMHDKYNFSSSTPFAEVFNEEEMRELARLTMQQHRATFGTTSVPDAPFDKNWHELAMKRMLRYASENGYDAIAWTKGEQQAERYGITKVVKDIYVASSNVERYVSIKTKSGDAIEVPTEPNSDVIVSGDYKGQRLSDVVGKELADKIISVPEGTDDYISGDDLKVGGEGMKGFYDKMLPAFMNKYGKKWGIKVADITLPNVERAGRVMHSVPVTDAMKESVMEGQPMFMKRPNGTVYGWTDGKKIYLTKAGINPNTPVHEYTHLWAKAMMQKNPKGWQSIKDLLRGTPVWNEVLNDPNYSSIHSNEDLVASEVLSRISGTQNAAKLEQMAQQMIDEAKGTARKLEARGLIQNIKDALNKFWNWVGTELFGIDKFDSVEQITDRVLWDLMNATDLGSLEEGQTEFSIIPEGELKEKLKKEIEDGEYITLYRAVRKINGKYYSPKMSKLGGVGQEIVMGELEQSDERPDLAYPVTMADGTVKYKVNLDGSDPAGTGLKSRTTNKVDYNPYIHASDSMMNDQFTAAFAMPEMTVIEVRVPKSELTSGYHAEKAADHVGLTPWKSGTVDLKLPKDEQRNVYLSRYDMPVREVPTEEIADHIAAKLLRNGLSMPYNLVTPQVAEALIRRGVDVSEKPSGNVPAGQNEKFKELKERVLNDMKDNDSPITPEKDADYRKTEAQNAAVDYLAGEPRLRAIENAVNEEASKLGVKVTYKTREQMPEGHKNDKGYYDTKTGEIVICTENATSIADAIQTILHEAVAHKGLRQLMGDKFNEFINRVYDSLDAETKAKVDALAEEHYNGNKAVAMEEYMATLAETTDFADNSVWDKIKSIFEDIINAILGRNDIKIGDNELRYILRASYNNMVNPRNMETVRGWAQDQMMREEYKINEATPDILSRTGIDPDEVARETAKAVYERIVNENWQEFQRQFQDAMQPVRIAIDAIQQETGNLPIEDYENFLLMFNQASSRSRVEIDDFSRRYYSPIIEQVNRMIDMIMEKRGWNVKDQNRRAEVYAEVRQYLIAKHGLERNKYYQETKKRPLNKEERKEKEQEAYDMYQYELSKIPSNISKAKREAAEAAALTLYESELAKIKTMTTADLRDYAGLTALFGYDPTEWEDAEAEAQRFVDEFERGLGRVDRMNENGEILGYEQSKEIIKLWEKINKATDKTLRHSYESGLISRSQYEYIKSMFGCYIPLRGFDETTAEDVYSYARFEGNRFNPAVHKVKGRTSVADDPLAIIMNMAESEIAQGNKNRAKQALYNFLLNRPVTGMDGSQIQNSLMQVEDVWYIRTFDENGDEVYTIATPDHESGETYEEFEERMRALEGSENSEEFEDGEEVKPRTVTAFKSKKGKLNIGMRFQKPANMNAHYVFLKVNGVEKAIYINGDPKAAQAINGEHKKQRGALAEKMGILNRFISSMFTNYSLEFTARNYFRDMFYSHINIDVKESDPAYRKKFRQNWRHNNLGSMVKMLKAYRAGEYEGRDLNEDEKAFVEFMRNGGQTGYTLINSVETHKKDLERAIANMQKGVEKGGVKDSTIFKFTLGSIELLNEASELVTRFAAFKTSRDMGRGINTSIADAKEVTVNFNTKGAQDGKGFMGMISHYFGWSKYFFNASVQGVQNLKSMAEANKLKFGSVIGGMVATGFLMPVITSAIASLFGNDDEEYWNIPEYERQNNFCVPIGNGKYVKVPLPIGFREVYAIGDMVAGAAFNKKFTRDLSQVGTDIANKLASIILPINPLESTANGLGFWHMFAYTTLPSFAQVAIQNMTNTDWKGAPLQKEYTYNEDDPQWMKAFGSNPDWMKGLSKWCNEHINLDGDYKGMDWSPERLDNTLSNVFGGIYSLVKKTGKSISMIWNEENRNLSNIPLSGVVLGSGIDNDDRFVTDAYYDMKEYYDSNVNYINRMAKRFGYTLEDVFEKEKGKHHPKMNEIYSNENFDFMQEWYTGVKELDAINDKIKKLDKKIAAKETPTEQDMLKWSRLNDKYMTERRDFVNDMLELD